MKRKWRKPVLRLEKLLQLCLACCLEKAHPELASVTKLHFKEDKSLPNPVKYKNAELPIGLSKETRQIG